MEKREDSYSFFEEEMRKNIDDSGVDYKTVELNLFSRIMEANHLGGLEVLKLEEMLLSDTFEKIESKLFSQIAQYNEYDVPTNECISSENDLSESQWDRLETKIDEFVNNYSKYPLWEQCLMVPENEPSPGKWEQIEEQLFERINTVAGSELWEQTAMLDEVQIQEALEAAEKKLDRRMEDDLEDWECVLKSEVIIPYSGWEAVEDKLFDRIENESDTHKPLSLEKQPFWNILETYLFTLKTVRNVSAALILALLVTAAYIMTNSANAPLPTFVYQVQGCETKESFVKYDDIKEKKFSAADGGALSIVNKHGMVELQNGSDLSVEKLTNKRALYKVGFRQKESAGAIPRGRVAFLVNPHKKNESFRVKTPDYQIIVKGTFFRVEPDLYGKMTTRVLEGEVKIESKAFNDTVIKAGQSLSFDLLTNEYKIQGGGPVLLRKDLETVPEVNDLRNFKAITIKSSVLNADVRIDGRYFGTLPLTIRQPSGIHHIWVGKNGYHPVDTIITLEKDNEINLEPSAIMLSKPEKNPSLKKNTVESPTSEKTEVTPSPESVAYTLLGNTKNMSGLTETDSLYKTAQKEEAEGNWRVAISMYQKIFDNPLVSSLRKEDALFSIGKLRADNEISKADAREVFLTYLAMYPAGYFAGETWLRLAELEFKSNPENAVQYYLKYFEMFPRHPRISELQNRVGVIYLQQKKYDLAISIFRQALTNMVSQSKGERENVLSNLYSALEAKGDSKSADSLHHFYNMKYTEDK